MTIKIKHKYITVEILITVILLILKLTKTVDMSWWLVFLPLWFLPALIFSLMTILATIRILIFLYLK